MTFLPGDRLSAGDLNALTTFARMAGSQTVNNSTTLVSAVGLSFTLEGDTTYAVDGWLRYTSNPTADIKFGWAGSAAGAGWWALLGPMVSTAPVTGKERQNYTDFSSVALNQPLVSAGDDESTGVIDICAVPRGYFTTTTAGTFVLQFAQSTANASNTILGVGSWLRVSKID